MGTSLTLPDVGSMIKAAAKDVHHLQPGGTRVVFVNKTKPPRFSTWEGTFDAWIEGDVDGWVLKVQNDWNNLRSSAST